VPSGGAVAACVRALGARRDAFATADTVADLDALRRALRDARWTVAGVSYGAFVAERYALAHPSATRAVVLDSVVPQEGVELLSRVPLRATARVLRAVDGPQAVTDLRAVLAAHPDVGPPLFDTLTERSIGVPRLGDVPGVLHQAAGGDLSGLRALLRGAATEQQGVPPALFSAGLHAATLCADAPPLWPGGPAAAPAVRDATLTRLRTRLPTAQTAPWPRSVALDQGLLATCRAWAPTPAPPAPARTARIRAPALLLAGDRDLSTPLEWARAQARRMPNAKLVVVPGAGHSILSRETGATGRDALRAFLSPGA
jgi:pimeloyl-ACP methyl ester carboxylesterase